MIFLLVLATITAFSMALVLIMSTFERVVKTPGNASLVPLMLVIWVVAVIIITYIGFSTGSIGVWVK